MPRLFTGGFAEGAMKSEGYTLIEVPVVERLWPEIDLIVAVMEHVRLGLRAVEPRVPAECELILLAGGTSHNESPVPLLAMHVPPHLPQGTDWLDLHEFVETWCEGKSDDELRAIGRATVAPTWSELLASGVHPASQGES
jgi:hypothetical protein